MSYFGSREFVEDMKRAGQQVSREPGEDAMSLDGWYGGAVMSETVIDAVLALSDAEAAFVARWVALARPEVAEAGLAALRNQEAS